jgi:hypothetical protein
VSQRWRRRTNGRTLRLRVRVTGTGRPQAVEMTRNRDLNGYLSLRVRVRLNISGLLVKGQIVYLFLSYYLPPKAPLRGTKMTSPLEQADDGGGLTISSMVKEFQGLKDKFKREDADSRELSVYIYFELLSPYSFSLLRP